MRDRDRTPTTYASAFDLPTFVELQQQARSMKALSLLKPSIRPELRELEAEISRLATLIDRFYDTLGTRNWLYHEDLNVNRIGEISELNSLDEQEAGLIALYQEQDTLPFMVQRLWRHEGMRQRLPLLEAAVEDYRAGRYAGIIHVLISVMDGFVNDFETNPRKGLHARGGDDMTAWDSVTSHHKGLAHVHETVFRKGFYKLCTDEVFDLYRHGIVHGTLVNFANIVVATKAWNYLFAVADWATARERAAQEPEPQPTMGEAFRKLADLGVQKKAVASWQAREIMAGEDGFESQPIHETCRTFLALWQKRNYGGMSERLGLTGSPGLRTKPGEVKDLYRSYTLTAFTLTAVRYQAPAVALVDVELTVNGVAQPAALRWLYQDEAGSVRTEPEPGTWRLVPWGPTTFLEKARAS
jgi:hypothetical protein